MFVLCLLHFFRFYFVFFFICQGLCWTICLCISFTCSCFLFPVGGGGVKSLRTGEGGGKKF